MGESLVRIQASAICGSERAALAAGSDTNAGHEAAGIVDETGELVGIAAVAGCMECSQCQAGREIYCPRNTIQTGMHAEYVVAATSTLRKIPEGMSPQLAALASGDALGVPVRALRRAPSSPGEKVVVSGLGPVGLAHVLVRSFLGARVIGVDPSPERRKLGLVVGATETLEPQDEWKASLIIEASGSAASVQSALDRVQLGGTVLQSGECSYIEIDPAAQIVHREVTYTGSWYYALEDYATMLKLLEEGLPIERLVTHEFDREEVQQAFDVFLSTQSGKVILRWS